jgi:hypothetical protein
VDRLAKSAALVLMEDNSMPANNRMLVWRKEAAPAATMAAIH